MATESNRSNVLAATIIGGAVGALVALLLAPKSGREFREDIKGTVQTLQSKSSEWVEQAKNTTADTIHLVAEHGSELLDKAKSAADSAAQSARSATESIAQAVHRTTDQAADSIHKTTNQAADSTHKATDAAANAANSTINETKRLDAVGSKN
jgi:gas vesicle protein